jgi:hypothetical protein
MNSKSLFTSPAITALSLLTLAGLVSSEQAAAQAPSPKPATTWRDLGFNQVPEGLSADLIPLSEGLNEGRGSWSFEGEAAGDDGATAIVKGSLEMQGNPKAGMIPIWQMAWGWPADDPGRSIVFNIMAGPSEDGFELMLIRIGLVKKPGAGGVNPEVQRTRFQGTWNLESRTITWTERGMPGQPAVEDPPKARQSFDMVVAADGKILIRNSKQVTPGQLVSARAVVRTGEAPEEPVVLTGKLSFKTVGEIADDRIKPWLPPQARDISLLSERGGHFARYKVAEDHFMKFLDGLWEADKGNSAHQRDAMHGEGEQADREGMARRFKAAGWEPLNKAVVYHSPSKGSGAMTTYYFDRQAGVVYHDRGYW